ncbi:hypothetical protein [Paenibacillus ferrarius]|uniref:hypothetical protein n=1 Tax=Paenibacillus ferrarius TaxID=1469647 RepID=UPI003D28F496
MKYAAILTQYIKASGLSLNELCMKLTERGTPIDRSYISKLKNGHKVPANDDISQALAEVTGGDADELIVAGFMENAPQQLKKPIQEIDFFLQDTLDMVRRSTDRQLLQQSIAAIAAAEIKNEYFKKIVNEVHGDLEIGDLQFSLSIISTVGIEMLSLHDKLTLTTTVLKIYRNMEEITQIKNYRLNHTPDMPTFSSYDKPNHFLVGQKSLERIDEFEFEFLAQCLTALRNQKKAWERETNTNQLINQ